jgi:CRP/FNR family transcriptional regulator
MLREQPEASLKLFEALSRWLRQLVDQLENETFLNTRSKLANYLLREMRHQKSAPGRCTIQLPQAKKDVASQLGMAPESYSRAQGDLEEHGLIRATGRQIEILDAAKLEDLLLGDLAEE